MKMLSVQEAQIGLSDVIYNTDILLRFDIKRLKDFHDFTNENNFKELYSRSLQSQQSINCNNHIFTDLCLAIRNFDKIWHMKSIEIAKLKLSEYER